MTTEQRSIELYAQSHDHTGKNDALLEHLRHMKAACSQSSGAP